MNSREIATMRAMEWEHCKGSLKAILASFWDWEKYRGAEDLSFNQLCEIVEKFIEVFGEGAALD